MDKITIQQAAREAVGCQDGCNSRGIARSMVRAMDAVADAGSHANTHAITYLFLYKLMALNGHEPLHDWEEYNRMERTCIEIAAIPETAPVEKVA